MRSTGFVTARSWDQIASGYRELLARSNGRHITGLLTLIEHIRSTPAGGALFGATSVGTLMISPYDRFDLTGEVLHVQANGADGMLTFHYASAAGGPRWEKRVAAELGPATFDRFLVELKWMVGTKRAADS